MDEAIKDTEQLHRVKAKPGPKPKMVALPVVECSGKTDAQNYAMRVWNGQSIDVPRAERIERCMNALRSQNLPVDGVTFP